jgi:hypothetical protein
VEALIARARELASSVEPLPMTEGGGSSPPRTESLKLSASRRREAPSFRPVVRSRDFEQVLPQEPFSPSRRPSSSLSDEMRDANTIGDDLLASLNGLLPTDRTHGRRPAEAPARPTLPGLLGGLSEKEANDPRAKGALLRSTEQGWISLERQVAAPAAEPSEPEVPSTLAGGLDAVRATLSDALEQLRKRHPGIESTVPVAEEDEAGGGELKRFGLVSHEEARARRLRERWRSVSDTVGETVEQAVRTMERNVQRATGRATAETASAPSRERDDRALVEASLVLLQDSVELGPQPVGRPLSLTASQWALLQTPVPPPTLYPAAPRALGDPLEVWQRLKERPQDEKVRDGLGWTSLSRAALSDRPLDALPLLRSTAPAIGVEPEQLYQEEAASAPDRVVLERLGLQAWIARAAPAEQKTDEEEEAVPAEQKTDEEEEAAPANQGSGETIPRSMYDPTYRAAITRAATEAEATLHALARTSETAQEVEEEAPPSSIFVPLEPAVAAWAYAPRILASALGQARAAEQARSRPGLEEAVTVTPPRKEAQPPSGASTPPRTAAKEEAATPSPAQATPLETTVQAASTRDTTPRRAPTSAPMSVETVSSLGNVAKAARTDPALQELFLGHLEMLRRVQAVIKPLGGRTEDPAAFFNVSSNCE